MKGWNCARFSVVGVASRRKGRLARAGVRFSDGRNFRALGVRGQRSQRANGESRDPLIATRRSSVSEHKTPMLTGHFIRQPVFARRDR